MFSFNVLLPHGRTCSPPQPFCSCGDIAKNNIVLPPGFQHLPLSPGNRQQIFGVCTKNFFSLAVGCRQSTCLQHPVYPLSVPFHRKRHSTLPRGPEGVGGDSQHPRHNHASWNGSVRRDTRSQPADVGYACGRNWEKMGMQGKKDSCR